MEKTYERHLTEIVAAMPTEPCIVALVPTIPLEDAAALASDVAQRVGKSRSGHTILTSFESHPSRIDHEIGVEGGAGLTEVLSKDVPMARAAAPGKARGFIYLPAGSGALRGEVLLRSEAWRMLSASMVKGGGTVLAVVPSTVFEAVNEGRSEGAGRRFDALVWLGPSGRSRQGVHRAAIASGARDLGGLQLPAGPEAEAPAARPASTVERRATPDRRMSAADRRAAPSSPSASERPRSSSSTQRSDTTQTPATIVGLVTQIGQGPRRRALERRKRRDRFLMIAVGVLALVLTVILLLREVL